MKWLALWAVVLAALGATPALAGPANCNPIPGAIMGPTTESSSTCNFLTVQSDGSINALGAISLASNPFDCPTIPGMIIGGTPPNCYFMVVNADGSININGGGGGGVTSFNTRTGAVTLASGDVTTALGFTPIQLSSLSGTSPVSYNSGTGAISCPTCGVTGSPLSQFASTTSAQLFATLSNPTGSGGSAVFATGPTIASPTVTGAFIATGLVTNADLANSSITIAGHAVSLGGTQALACADLSNGAASCATDATNASNISTGTLAAARGGAGTITGALKGNGAGVVSQAACADLANGATGCSTTVGTAATANTGTSGAALCVLNGAACTFANAPVVPANAWPLTSLAQAAGGTMLANTGSTTGNITATINPVLGIEGTSTGTLRLNQTTASNSVTLTPGTGGNDAIITFPATTDTVTYNGLAQTLSSKTLSAAALTGASTAVSLASSNANGFKLAGGAASATAPTLTPRAAGTTTGIGGASDGDFAIITGGVQTLDLIGGLWYGKSGTPTMGACGTSPSVTGSDMAMTVTTGSGTVTACTVNFNHTWASTPRCTESDSSTAITGDISAISTTAVTVSFSATLTSGTIYLICVG